MTQDIEELARKFALENAVNHDGKANAGSVIGKVIGTEPDLKDRISEVKEISASVTAEVNSLSAEEQLSQLRDIAPELLEKEKVAKELRLPDLEGAEGGVVMRLAPNPSGPLHLGHTRMAILNDEYVKRYGGKLIVRMEDTNPEAIMPEAYEMILADLDYLEVEYHEVVNQSERFDVYIEWATKLIELGKAYMCQCEPDSWRALKEEQKACPHRDADSDTNSDLWNKMLAGEFGQGDISLVVKTDLDHPNPAVRDFVAMRILDAEHPKTGDTHHVLPLYNFSVAVDDYLMGMTHVLRGKDHLNNTLRQEYVYEHLGWKKPYFHHYGWVSIEGTVLSTRQIKADIEDGQYPGWDDPRLGTVAALAKRGIQPQAIRNYWIEVGIKGVDIKFAWDNLFAYNKDIIDPIAHRYFFVWEPILVRIEGAQALEGKAPLLPDNPDAGYRETRLTADEEKFIYLNLTTDDLDALNPGSNIRLKDLCNLEYLGDRKFKYIGNDLDILKQGAGIAHWVGADNVPARVLMPDGETTYGAVERQAKDDAGNVVQFERFGFVRIEEEEEGIVGYFGHK